MSYFCAYCDDDFSDNVMCPQCVTMEKTTVRAQDKAIGALRTVLAALKSRPAPSAVQRAERAVVRGAMRWQACRHTVGCTCVELLDDAVVRLGIARAKAKKERRP